VWTAGEAAANSADEAKELGSADGSHSASKDEDDVHGGSTSAASGSVVVEVLKSATSDLASPRSSADAKSGGTSPSATTGPVGNASSPSGMESLLGSPDSSMDARGSLAEQPQGLEKLRRLGTTKFNMNPRRGVEFLVTSGLITNTPSAFALFLLHTEGLSKKKIGEFFGRGEEFNQECLEQYLSHFDFEGRSLDDGLRDLLMAFRLPGEAQQIDRILEQFAKRYYETNQGSFTSQDTVFTLAFSLIMLNTDLHSRNIKGRERMTVEQFVRNNREIDGGRDLPREMLESLYESIGRSEIRMQEEDMYESDVVTFVAPRMSGWLHKKSDQTVKQWKRHWFVLTDGCLYYFLQPTDERPRCIIPLENVRAGRSSSHPRELLLIPSKGQFVKSVKKLSNGGMAQGQHHSFALKAANEEERDRWVRALQQELVQRPSLSDSVPESAHVDRVRYQIPPPTHEGWLRKRGDFNPGLRRRYFILCPRDHIDESNGPALYYHGSKELAYRWLDFGELTMKGFIHIGDVERLHVSQERAAYNEKAIELVTAERRWVLSPESEEDFHRWLRVLSDSIAYEGAEARKSRGLLLPTQRFMLHATKSESEHTSTTTSMPGAVNEADAELLSPLDPTMRRQLRAYRKGSQS